MHCVHWPFLVYVDLVFHITHNFSLSFYLFLFQQMKSSHNVKISFVFLDSVYGRYVCSFDFFSDTLEQYKGLQYLRVYSSSMMKFCISWMLSFSIFIHFIYHLLWLSMCFIARFDFGEFTFWKIIIGCLLHKKKQDLVNER